MDFPDLARLASGHVEARVLQAAVALGIFEALRDRGQPVSAISCSIHGDRRATELLLNALVALGLLKKKGDLFSLTHVASTYLLSDSPKYYGGMVLFESALWDAWRDLPKSIRSGAPVRPPDMYQRHPQETERFILAMGSLVQARGDARVLAGKLDLEKVTDLLDVGSGPGTYPIYFCQRFPSLRATIFELPATAKITERFVQASGVSDRIRLVQGDYRADSIPGNYQMAFLSNIIHAESSEENGRLMAKLYARLDRGGRIVIKDHILDDALTHPPVGAVFSLLMLLTTEAGRCYSFQEVRGWLEGAGFKRVRAVSLPQPLTSSLVIGRKE